MTDILKVSKRTFAWSVVALTAIASLMAAALMAPASANAQQCPSLESGDLVQFEGSNAVYILNDNLKRMYYPKSEVYHTWHADFSGVNVVETECAQVFEAPSSLPLGVNYRPGSNLVKVPLDNAVYAVTPDNTLRKIGSESVAKALHGDDWAGEVRDVADAFWPNYTDRGSEITEAIPYNGMLIQKSGDDTVYHVRNDMLHEVDGTLPSFLAKEVETVSDTVFNKLSMASDTVTPASIAADPTQGAGADAGDGQDGQDGGDGDQVSAGSLDFSLSANTPESQTIPASSTHVGYMSFNVSAGDEAVTFKSLDIQRFGLGGEEDFGDVWLEVNGEPVTGSRSLSSDDKATLNPDYEIPANSTVEFSVVADMDGADTSHQNGFRITSADMVEAGGAEITGDFPISGNKMDYSSYSVGTVDISDQGSDTEVEAGDEQVAVGEFDVEYTSDNESDGEIMYMRFKQEGNADMEDLTNFALYEDGSEVSADTTVAGDYITFKNLDSNMVEDGETRSFSIRADIGNVDDTDTIEFRLDDKRDIHLKETATGFGASLDKSDLNCNSTADAMCVYTVDAGQLTVSLDSSSPGNEDYAKGTQDITAMVGKADVGQPISVDGLDVYLDTGTDLSNGSASDDKAQVNADIERAELLVNGSEVTSLSAVDGSEGSSTNDGSVNADSLHYSFDSSFELEDDDKISLRLDLEDDAASNTYKFTFDTGDFDDPEYTSDGDNVPSSNQSGTVTGNNVNIVDASVTVTRNDGYSTNEVFINGSGDQKLMQVLVSAGDSSDLTVRSLDFDFSNVDSAASSSYFTNFRVKFDGEQVGDTEDMDNSGNMKFENLNHTIEKNSQVKVELVGSIQKGLMDGTTSTITLDESDSDIEDGEGDVVSGWGDVMSATGLKFVDNANLSVALDSNSPDATVVAANSTVDVAEYRFSATDGDISIDELYLANNTSTATANAADAGADDRIQEYQLVVDGNVIDSRVPSSGKVNFSLGSGNEIVVEKDKVERAKVRAVLHDITEDENTGKELSMALYGLEATTEGSGSDLTDSDITGTVSSSDSTAALDNAPTADTMLLARTVPTLTTQSLSDTSLANTNKDIYKFTVSADDNFDVTWKEITLDVSGNCNGGSQLDDCLSNFKVEENGTEKSVASSSMVNTSTSAFDLKIEMSNARTISAGSSKTYTVSADLSNFTGDNDSLGVRIVDNESSPESGDWTTIDGSNNTFAWADNSGDYESTTNGEAHWFDGWEALGLDTDTASLKQ